GVQTCALPIYTQLNVGDVRRAGRNTDARDGDGVGGELRLVDNRRHGRYLLSQRGQRCEQTCNGEYGNRHDGEWTNDGFGTHNLLLDDLVALQFTLRSIIVAHMK